MDTTLVGSIVAGLLTLMVFSYLLGANPLWRIAQSLLVGVSVGYITLVLLTQVIAPQVARVVSPAAGAGHGGDRPIPIRALSTTGRWVLVVTFGAILGSLATTFYAALIERLEFLLNLVTG